MITPFIGMEWTFYLYGITLMPLVVLCRLIRDERAQPAAKRAHYKLRDMHFGRLFKNYYFVTFVIFNILMNVPAGTVSNFLPYRMAEIGVDANQIGTIFGYKALLEIPMLYLMIRFRRRFSLPQMQFAAAALFVGMCAGYACSMNFATLMLVSTVYGLAGGIDIGTATNYIYILAPKELKATAQTVYGAVSSLASIGGNLAAGVLMERMGIQSFSCWRRDWCWRPSCFYSVPWRLASMCCIKKSPKGRGAPMKHKEKRSPFRKRKGLPFL